MASDQNICTEIIREQIMYELQKLQIRCNSETETLHSICKILARTNEKTNIRLVQNS